MVFKLPKKEVMISSDIGKEIIKKELPLIPKLPGVYRMLNDKGDILYVGKAKIIFEKLTLKLINFGIFLVEKVPKSTVFNVN